MIVIVIFVNCVEGELVRLFFKRESVWDPSGASARDGMNSQVSRKEEKQKDDWSFRGRKKKKSYENASSVVQLRVN